MITALKLWIIFNAAVLACRVYVVTKPPRLPPQ
jgi:hypothetical protein